MLKLEREGCDAYEFLGWLAVWRHVLVLGGIKCYGWGGYERCKWVMYEV